MQLNIEIEVQGCDQSDISVTNQCETLTLEIIDAPTGGGVVIDDAAGIGDTDVTWSADKSSRELADKVDKVSGYSLVADDEIAKLLTVEQDAQKNTVNSVAGKQGDVLLDKSDVGLGLVDNTSDADKPVSTAVADALAEKVDAEAGKQLSDENYTLAEKQKLDGIADEATKNRDDSENADKLHTHAISDVTGLSARLSDTDTLIRRYILSTPFTPYHLFIDKEKGFWADPSDTFSLFQNSDGTIPVVDGDPIGLVLDKSGNNYNLTQTVSTRRPKLLNGGIVFDRVDDALTLTVPAGGITGTLFLATTRGTASYGVSMPAGVWTLGNAFNPLGNVVSAVLVDRALTVDEKARLHVFGIGKGGTEFGAETTFLNAFRGWNYIVDFPLLDISNVSSFQRAWYFCSSLTSFPANFFDNCLATNFSTALSATNLSQASLDGILVSINSNATSNGTFDQSGGSAPSAVGQAAIDSMRSRGWTVTTTGGY